MTLSVLLLALTLVAGLYMAWMIGANDVANAMGTSVGSGALTLGMAIVLAGIFEFGGAVLVGSHVTQTISKGIVETSLFATDGPLGTDGPMLLAVGMACALLTAAVWLHLSTAFGLPVSTTHSIVGAVVGIGVVTFGFGGVAWGKMGQIVASWVISPVLGGALAAATFIAIRRLILRRSDPTEATRRLAPYLIALVVTIMALSFIYKAMKNRLDAPPLPTALSASLLAGAVIAVPAGYMVRRTRPRSAANPYAYVERVFALLQVATACLVAFAHGANDVANAVGPVAAVVSLEHAGFHSVTGHVGVPLWVLILGGGGIVVGLGTFGYRVIRTIGKEITDITPTRGFSAEFGAATTVLVASSLGLPVSTTHTLVGAVVGVGFAQGIGALNLDVLRSIAKSWLATVPFAAVMAAVLFLLARLLLF